MVEATTELDGRRIHYVTGGAAEGPPLMLIHGGGAHVGWWHLLAPLLGERWRTVAIDLSGHSGDSDRRPAYSVEGWCEEVATVPAAVGGAPMTLVGHSMGGGIALATAALYPELARGVALLDSAVWWPGLMRMEAEVQPTVYPTREAAIAAFRLMPPQPVTNAAAQGRLAPMSIAPVDGGWTWKWDPAALHAFDSAAVRALLPRIRCPVLEIAGSESDLVTTEALEMLDEELPTPVPCIEVAGAYHHVMLDRPREVAAALEPYLAAWQEDGDRPPRAQGGASPRLRAKGPGRRAPS